MPCKLFTRSCRPASLAPQTSCDTVGDTEEENNKIKTDRDSNVYSGFSILTPYSNNLLQKRIAEFLYKNQEYLKSLYQKHDLLQSKLDSFIEKIDNFIKEYKDQSISTILEKDYKKSDFNDPIFTAFYFYQKLKGLDFLSQSLGGFNQALLMRKQTLQLMIDDPIGFEDYQRFTKQVQELVGEEVRSAPQPLDDFNPIRAGGIANYCSRIN